ncbi:Protein of unknown function [Cotesia congregata]|uniref:Uncharacterized protein n=1 Tax=Cotesia congregata TaxID=51543 RepID=A0A8J2H9R8_COTCN|nr:Protein of unknown function [Cotesia congregata]
MFQAKKKLERKGLSQRRIDKCLRQLECQPKVVVEPLKIHGFRYFKRFSNILAIIILFLDKILSRIEKLTLKN